MIVDIVKQWMKCRKAMLTAIEKLNGTHSEDGILARLFTKQMHLLTNGSTGIVLEIVEYECFKALNVFLLGGNIDEVAKLVPEIERLRVAHGCKRVMGLATPDDEGRSRAEGWSRLFEAKPFGTFMYRDY